MSGNRKPGLVRTAATLALLLAAVAGCGFHLQGRMPLPESVRTVYLEAADEQSDFAQALRSSLLSSGAHVVRAPGPSAATLAITTDRITERVLSVSARNIPTDYELTYEVQVAVSGAGRELMAPESVSLSRIYSFDETKLLAKDREKKILVDALARDMAGVVMRRLSSLQ